MKNFFVLVFKRGLLFLFIVLLVWIFYFILNFMFPHMFDFLRVNTTNQNQSATSTLKAPSPSWRDRLYNTFFASRTKPNVSSTSSESELSSPRRQSYWDSSSTTSSTWGSEESSWGGVNTNKLKSNDLYIFANLNNSIAQNFRINNILIKKDFSNILTNGNIITGEISNSYLSQYFFNIDIYNEVGEYLFSIPANAYTDLKNKDILHFSAIYKNSQNMSGYLGDGFMVIRTDNNKVDGILIIKIKID